MDADRSVLRSRCNLQVALADMVLELYAGERR